MTRRAHILLILSALFVLLVVPVAAQDETPTASPDTAPAAASGDPGAPAAAEASAVPSAAPLPTAMPLSDGPLVQAVKFFSPTCPHCHTVITETLPPLFGEHGGDPVITFDESVPAQDVAFYLMSNGRLQILLVDVSMPAGQTLFGEDSARLRLDRAGVPRMDVDDSYLVGSGDIPDRFPDMVKDGFSGDGIDWPPVPGLGKVLAPFITAGAVPDPAGSPGATKAPSAKAAAGEAAASGHDPFAVIPVAVEEGPLEKMAKDPVGNGIAIVVLVLLGISIIAAPLLAVRGSLPAFPSWLTLVLVIVGMAVAAYLANVETSDSEAVCGPVGDCNAVQESEYAQLFGIHIGVLGMLGYALIGLFWIISRVAKGALADWSLVFIALGAIFGAAFSAYLTFLEPFVIGATCMWCITSALVMLALLWVSAGPGYAAWLHIRGKAGGDAEVATA